MLITAFWGTQILDPVEWLPHFILALALAGRYWASHLGTVVECSSAPAGVGEGAEALHI